MDPTILPKRTDFVSITSEARPTPRPAQARFSEVLANGASGLVQGAEMVMSALPGGPIVAAAVRGGATPTQTAGLSLPLGNMGGLGAVPGVGGVGSAGSTTVAEGPGALGALGTLGSGSDGGVAASLAQSQQSNLYYLQIQQQVNAQSQTFETLSNVLKSESDTIKNAISNLH